MDNSRQNDFYVYALKRPDIILNNEPQPFYIGKGYGNRMYVHIGLDGSNSYKDNIIRKLTGLGLKIIYEKLIENLTESKAFEEEIELIAFYGRYNNNTGILTNMTDGGEGMSGASKETKQKMSEAQKGKKNPNYGKHFTEETKQKLSEAMKGRHHTNEAKQKISESRKGYKHSKETKQKMSEAKKGKHHSSETCKKISEANKGINHPMYGKHHTDETKQKMSKSNIGKLCSEETRQKLREAQMGKHHTEKTKQKMSEAIKKYWLAKKLSEEYEKKLNESYMEY